MIYVLSYNHIPEEQDIIQSSCCREVAKKSNENLHFLRVTTQKDVQKLWERPLHIIYYEISHADDVEMLKILRKLAPQAMLMLLTSSQISPEQYLKPGIAPDMLLLRPFFQEEFDEVNDEFLNAFFNMRKFSDSDSVFVVSVRDGKTAIPYCDILFFEANNKKINLRVEDKEYEFYGSIENIMQTAPPYFIRTHRAFLVNSRKIRSVNKKEGLLILQMGVTVPLSRTYRHNVKL